MNRILLIVSLFSMPAFAKDENPVNYCQDKQVSAEWEKMLSDAPEDPLIIKLYGLRIGLCSMIEKGQISLQQGIDIWEQERVKAVTERTREDADRNKEFTF